MPQFENLRPRKQKLGSEYFSRFDEVTFFDYNVINQRFLIFFKATYVLLKYCIFLQILQPKDMASTLNRMMKTFYDNKK